ncbi:MAG: hypothetical protein M1358_03975 [Chloroflexi bacterium]|nr:hypothetical protein [Chloroflexota bacterium]
MSDERSGSIDLTSIEEAQAALRDFEVWFGNYERNQGRKLGKQSKKMMRKKLEALVAETRVLKVQGAG